MEKIETEGFNVLEEKEKKEVLNIFNESYKKIKELLKNNLSLKFQLRIYEKKKGKKYSIHGEVIYPGQIITAQAHDYDIARTAHKLINKIEKGIEKKFHSSDWGREKSKMKR